jgi:outer membrane autotransporter protein
MYVYHIYDGGPQSASVAGALTVNAAGNAYGIELLGSNGSTATASVGGILNISASVSGAVGALLETNGSESLTYSSAATVSGAGGNSFGAYLIGANFLPQQATFLDKLTVINTSGGAAYGVYMSQGAGSTVTLTKTLSVSTTGGGQVIGVDFDSIVENPTRFFGATLHNPTAIAVNSDTGAVTGVSATNLRGDFLIDGAGTITATSAGAAAGVITTGVTGTQTLTLGAVTATSTESTATGVGLSGVGETTYPSGAAKIAISLTDASTIAANSHASSGSGGAGVNLAVTGAAATIVVDLNAVATTGAATPGVVLQGANGLISGTINSITTSGANSPGLTVTGATAGAVNLTVGIAGSTPSGGVSTIGAGSDGIDITTSTGTATVTASTVEVSGAGSYGLSIQTTSTTTGGAVTLTTGAVTGSGAASLNAINVQTGVGAISVTTTGNTSAANADTIRLASTSGNVTAALGDGTTTTSSTGVALNISTGGLATVTLGYSATTAALAGKSWGLEVSAAGGLTATLSGTVGSTSGGAIDASGGATSITNKGTINGYMMLSNAGNTFTNVGTFNAFGGDTTFGGTSTFNNSGTFNVYPGAVSATTLNLKGLTTLNNSGTISLANGHTGNVLNLQGAAYTGSGGATLVLDVNLANTAVNGSAAQSADLLKVGAISGSTKLALNDIGAGLPGQFNLTGIPVVAGTSSTPNAFTLAASPIQKGFVEYMLRQQGADYDLYSVPSAAAFELVRMGTEAQRYWRRSGDVWADQILGSDFKQGGSVWVQAFGGGETNNSHPTYSFATPAFNNSPVLDVRDNFGGVQGGYDWGHGAFGLGFTGGYTEQDGKLKATGDTLTFKGENVGLYARFAMANGFFAQGMGKIDFYDIDFGFAVSAGSPGFNGKTYGLDLQAGYRATSGKLFVEPILGLSVTHTDLDGFSANVGGVAATYGGGDSAYGKAGVRAGWTSLSSRSWRLSPYVGADWEGEMSGRPHVTLGLGASSLTFEDAPEGGRARVELGVSGIGPSGFSAFGKVEGVAGANAAGASVRVGLAWRW